MVILLDTNSKPQIMKKIISVIFIFAVLTATTAAAAAADTSKAPSTSFADSTIKLLQDRGAELSNKMQMRDYPKGSLGHSMCREITKDVQCAMRLANRAQNKHNQSKQLRLITKSAIYLLSAVLLYNDLLALEIFEYRNRFGR